MKIESFEQLQTLMNYGFTPEQIMNLSDDGTIPAAAADQEQAAAPEQASDPEQAADPEPAEAAEQEEDPRINALQTEVDNLKKQLQAANIKNASIDKIPADEQSVENILAGIIRPDYKKEDSNK